MLQTKIILQIFSIFITFQLSHSRTHNTKNQQQKSNDIIAIRNIKANEFLNFMNLSANPCTDFYEYACGNWPKDKEKLSPHQILLHKVNKDLQDILNERITAQDGTIGRKIKDFYSSCIDLDNVLKTQKSAFHEIIIDNGGMPAISGTHWNGHYSFNWIDLIGQLRFKYGIDILIGMEIQYQNLFHHRIILCEPKLLLIPKEMCNNKSDINLQNSNFNQDDLYEKLQKDIAENLNNWLDIRYNDALRIAGDIINFEYSFCKYMITIDKDIYENDWNLLDNSYTNYNNIDFYHYIKTSLGQPVPRNVYLKNENYLKNLSKIIQNTIPTTVVNYIMYMTLLSFSFPKYIQNNDDNNIKNQMKLHIEFCIEKIKEHFPSIIGEMYNRKFYRDDLKNDIDEMWITSKRSFDKNFDLDSQWMTDNTKRLAKYKLNSMQMEFPQYSQSVLEKDFHILQINKINSYWTNIRTIKRMEQDRKIRKLHLSNNNDYKQEKKSYDIDVQLIKNDNIIHFPIGLLQPTFYHLQYPNSIKYGQIGFQIGREMSKSFDEMITTNQLQDNESFKSLHDRTECFRIQFSNYLYNNPNEYNNYTELNELIADTVGINIAFNAYLIWLYETEDKKLLNAETLVDVDFTNSQLFFLSYAQTRCESNNLDDNLLNLPLNSHTYKRYRVNGPLSNFKEFAREFHCLPGTDMNPIDKCSIT